MILGADTVEKPFYGFKPAICPGAVLVTAFLQRFFKFLQQLELLFRQVDGGLDSNLREQITLAGVSKRGHTLAPQSKCLSGLGACRHFQRNMTVQRRQLHIAPQGRSCKTDRHLAGQVGAVTFKQFVFDDPDFNIQIA